MLINSPHRPPKQISRPHKCHLYRSLEHIACLYPEPGFSTICNTVYDYMAYDNCYMTSYDHIWSYGIFFLKI